MSIRKFALSVLALSAAAAAQAQSSYNVYGVIDLSVGSMQLSGLPTAADNKRLTKVDGNNMTTSYLGFKGVEDLGGGLKAGFTLEAFLRPDTGASGRSDANTAVTPNVPADNFWGRAANVYLQSDLGKVTIGRQGNLLFGQVVSYNPFGGAFGLSPAVRLTFGKWGNDKGDSSWSNAITYSSPNLAGFTGSVSYQAGEDSTLAERNSYALSANYANGPFAIGGAWQTVRSAEAPKINLSKGQRQNFGLIGSSYDLGVAKLFAQYGEFSNSGFATTSRIDTKLYQLGASVPLTKMSKLMLSYGESKETPVQGGTTPVTKHRITSLGYDLNLSKRTDVYAVVMVDKEQQANWESGTSVVFGLRHAF
jgi:predicted porin